ncbi:MAG: ArsC/Spx/MgsR family protein [Chloroflexota bacterium]
MRFFRERRVEVSFVDVARKPIAAGELRRFTARFGAAALMYTDSPRYRDAGLAYLSMDEEGAFDRLLCDQSLLRLPLVRAGAQLSVGVDEGAWRSLLAEAS